MTEAVATTEEFLFPSTDNLEETSTVYDVTPNSNSAALKARWPYFFFVLLLLAAIFCNVVVITSVFFYDKLHGLFYYGIASLSASHLVYMILVAPFLIARSILEDFPFASKWCHTWVTLDSIITAASNIHLCVLAYLLQIMFVNPLKYKLWHTKKSILQIIGSCWVLSILLSIPSIVFWFRSSDETDALTNLPLQDLFGCGILESSYIYSQVVPCYLTGTICFLGLFYRLFLGIKYQNMLAKNLQSPGAKRAGVINGKVPRKGKRLNSNGECSEVSSSNSDYLPCKGGISDIAKPDVEIGEVIVHVESDMVTDSGRSSMCEEAGIIDDEVHQINTGPREEDTKPRLVTETECSPDTQSYKDIKPNGTADTRRDNSDPNISGSIIDVLDHNGSEPQNHFATDNSTLNSTIDKCQTDEKAHINDNTNHQVSVTQPSDNKNSQENHHQSETVNTNTVSNQNLEGIENPSYIQDEQSLVSLNQNPEMSSEIDKSHPQAMENKSSSEQMQKSTTDDTVQGSLPVTETNDQECKIQSHRPSILKKNTKEIELERVCSTKSVSFAHNVKKRSSTKSIGVVSIESSTSSISSTSGHKTKSPGQSKQKARPQNRPALKLVSAQEYMKTVNKAHGAKLMTRISDNKGTVLMLLVMYIMYVGLTLPYQMYHVVMAVNRQTSKAEPVTENAKDLLAMLQWIATCGTLVNPIVYWLFSEHFRKGYAESYISCCDRDQKYYRDRQKRFGMIKEGK